MYKIVPLLLLAFLLLGNQGLRRVQGAEADANDAGTVSRDTAGSSATVEGNKAAKPAQEPQGGEIDRRRQKNLERLRQRREQMMQRRRQAGSGRRQRAGKAIAGGPHQRLEQLSLQLERENDKHTRRLARLNRIKELAAAEGLTKVAERADKLRKKELQRHNRKQQRLQSEVRNLARSELRRRQTERLKKGAPAARSATKLHPPRPKSPDAAKNNDNRPKDARPE